MSKYAGLLLVLFLGLTTVQAQERTSEQLGVITAAILERGQLLCGVTDDAPGFGFRDDEGAFAGFDIDVCRAVAAAILGDADAVEYIVVVPADRAAALNDGSIDMLSRNSTWTFTRDAGTEWNAIFGPTTFYDGQGIMVYADSGIGNLRDLAGRVICTASGTTTELNLDDAMTSRGLQYELLTFADVGEAFDGLVDGNCDALTTDRSGLAGYRSQYETPTDLVILDSVLSKEPLGPLSPQSDPQFADIIRWTIYGMIQAEEFNITSENIGSIIANNNLDNPRANPSIQRMLGIGIDSGVIMGIPNDFMQAVIRQIGNYGEVFERHLTPLGLQRGLNDLWINGGLMYAPPFR
jgi:general L-amino acid transport system substrate-binding protein